MGTKYVASGIGRIETLVGCAARIETFLVGPSDSSRNPVFYMAKRISRPRRIPSRSMRAY